MARINYPDDWYGIQNISLIIDYPQLIKLAKANNLNDGHVIYLARNITDRVLGNINEMLEDKNE